MSTPRYSFVATAVAFAMTIFSLASCDKEAQKLYRDYDGNKVSLNLIFPDNGDEKIIDTFRLEKYPGSVTIFRENNRKNEILFLFHRTLQDETRNHQVVLPAWTMVTGIFLKPSSI